MVEEALVGGNLKAVEVALAAVGGVGAEEGLGFGGFERSDLGDGEGREIERDLGVGEGDIAGDTLCCGAGGAPVTFFLRCGRQDGEETDEGNAQQVNFLHPLRMAFDGRCGNCVLVRFAVG